MKSGIYQIKNLVNKKKYIGSTKNFNSRKHQHLYHLRRSNHSNKHLQNAWNIYGENVFVFEILEECDVSLIIKKEQYYIDLLKPEYNIRKIAASNLGFKHSTNTKNKIKETSKQMWKKEGQKENFIQKLSKPIICYTKDGHFYKEFLSAKEASIELNIESSHITKICKLKANIRNGFIFRYKTENYPLFLDFDYLYENKKRTAIENAKNNRKRIEIFINNESVGIFNSIKEASIHFNISHVTISALKQNKENYSKKKTGKYYNWEIIEL